MATTGPVTPVTVISVSSPQVQAPPPPSLPPPVTEPEQEEQPVRVVAVADAPCVQSQPPTMMSPQPQAPLATAAPQQPGVYTPAQTLPISPQQAMTVATPPTPPAPTLFAQPATMPAVSAPMMQLQVLVPAPGLTPGQQLAFPAPMGAGQPPKQMVVKVQQGAAPGSVVTVQYPLPTPSPTLPNPNTAILSEAQADHNGAVAGWLMFGAGWCCLCTFFPFGFLIWAIGAALYFCKPPHRRANLRQSRTPAYASLITLFTCLALAIVVLLGFAAIAIADDASDFNFKPTHHRPQQHHGGLLKWGGPMNHHGDRHPPAMLEESSWTGEGDVTKSRQKHCPFARLKKMIMRVKRNMSGFDRSKSNPAPPPPPVFSGPRFSAAAKEAETIFT